MLSRLLADLVAMGCRSAVIDAWYSFVPSVLPDGRMQWTEAKPGDQNAEVHAYRIVLRPFEHLHPILVQHVPPPTFALSLLRSQVVVRDADPADCHPQVAALVAKLFRHPDRGLSVVR